jgi:hypothetical protein
MRLIREQVVGEISATSYKKLVKTLKPLGKRQLWALLDHYLFHVITDENADELLRHIQEMQQAGVSIEAATESEIADSLRQLTYRPKFEDTISPEILEANKTRLDVMFDESYFMNYVKPEERAGAARKLVAFCMSQELPVEDHWKEFAGGDAE